MSAGKMARQLSSGEAVEKRAGFEAFVVPGQNKIQTLENENADVAVDFSLPPDDGPG